jgi:hypothetical protein
MRWHRPRARCAATAPLASIAGSPDQAARTKAIDEARANLDNAARALDALAATLRS